MGETGDVAGVELTREAVERGVVDVVDLLSLAAFAGHEVVRAHARFERDDVTARNRDRSGRPVAVAGAGALLLRRRGVGRDRDRRADHEQEHDREHLPDTKEFAATLHSSP